MNRSALILCYFHLSRPALSLSLILLVSTAVVLSRVAFHWSSTMRIKSFNILLSFYGLWNKDPFLLTLLVFPNPIHSFILMGSLSLSSSMKIWFLIESNPLPKKEPPLLQYGYIFLIKCIEIIFSSEWMYVFCVMVFDYFWSTTMSIMTLKCFHCSWTLERKFLRRLARAINLPALHSCQFMISLVVTSKTRSNLKLGNWPLSLSRARIEYHYPYRNPHSSSKRQSHTLEVDCLAL